MHRADTRTRIVLAAERLFAERGIYAPTLREIVVAAGQRNTSAVQYHFGPDADLVAAVFEFRMSQVNDLRLEALAVMHASGRPSDLRSLVEALVLPLVTMSGRPGSYYARFLAQLSAHPRYRTPDDLQVSGSLAILERAVRAALADMPAEVFAERWRMVSHVFVQTVADHEGEAVSVRARAAWSERLVDCCLALLADERSTPTARAQPVDPTAVARISR